MSSEQNKNKIPGSCYISKIVEFFRFITGKGSFLWIIRKKNVKTFRKNSVSLVKRINIASIY